MNPKVVFLPDGDDPDSFSRKHTLEEIQEFIESHEQDGIAFKTDLLLSEAGDDPLKKANLINEIADTVADIPDAIKRQVYVDTVARRFGIEADIIQDRVRKTRENARKEMSGRAGHDGRGQADGQGREEHVMADTDRPSQAAAPRIGNITEPSERELLGFILRHGCSELKFETDSEFYNPDGSQTVAEFIDSALTGDSAAFSNPAFQAAYNAYFALYDEGLDQDSIVRSLLNGEDRTVASVVADLATEKYELTVHNFSDALTTTDSWLVTYVPRAILAYHDKRLQAKQADINRRLANASPEEANQLLSELSSVNALKKTINIKLGRIKK